MNSSKGPKLTIAELNSVTNSVLLSYFPLALLQSNYEGSPLKKNMVTNEYFDGSDIENQTTQKDQIL